MKNFVSSGEVLTVAAPAAVVSGQVVKVGQVIGVAATNAANGADVNVNMTGVYDLPKAAVAIAQGALVYWDVAAAKVTTATVGTTLLGCATKAALAGDATVHVRLNGNTVVQNA